MQHDVVLIMTDSLGQGSEELGQLLMRNYLKTLLDVSPLPERVLFLNHGAKLACEGSLVIESLKTLANKGVEILTCGTCLDYLHLKEKLQIGRITNMLEIVETLTKSTKIVRI